MVTASGSGSSRICDRASSTASWRFAVREVRRACRDRATRAKPFAASSRSRRCRGRRDPGPRPLVTSAIRSRLRWLSGYRRGDLERGLAGPAPGRERPRVGADRLAVQPLGPDGPPGRKRGDDQRGAAVDLEHRARTTDRAGVRDRERDDERAGRVVLDLDDHDPSRAADAVHPLDRVTARHAERGLDDRRPLDRALAHCRLLGRDPPPIVGADPPVDEPAPPDDLDRAALVDPGPPAPGQRTDQRHWLRASRRSSGFASRSMSAGTMSAGLRPW